MRSLSRIASVFGRPIFVDECTTKQTRVSYAQMLIEINVTKELPSEVWVMDPIGKKFLQSVTYDWKPAYCEKCQIVGHSYSEIQEFGCYLLQIGLTEFPWKGEYYTWTNKQPGDDRMMTWSHVETTYDLPQISDHNPAVLTLAASSWKGKAPFRFFNVWATHEDFHQIVSSIWNSSNNFGSLKTIWIKLKALKAPLKALNAKDFKDITQRIEKARLELKEIQEQLASIYSDGLLHKEKETLLNLEKWSLIEESVLQHKARAKWIQLGDSNTKYFTAVMKERSQRKQITEITNGLGDRVTDPAAIKREILGFYKALMGSTAKSLPAINKLYMYNGPILS
ncbi:uncharacterized protein LOC142162405 [Nicotiana tabacum]|uniref:Uncharacterized protein LOC142162405 n=1 Tax=Nicotiana tabacum TaxID=4097 RepID=A0AC58RQ59_TOBAC